MGVVVPKGGRGPRESDREAEGWGARGDTQRTMIDYSLLWVKGFWGLKGLLAIESMLNSRHIQFSYTSPGFTEMLSSKI